MMETIGLVRLRCYLKTSHWVGGICDHLSDLLRNLLSFGDRDTLLLFQAFDLRAVIMICNYRDRRYMTRHLKERVGCTVSELSKNVGKVTNERQSS